MKEEFDRYSKSLMLELVLVCMVTPDNKKIATVVTSFTLSLKYMNKSLHIRSFNIFMK